MCGGERVFVCVCVCVRERVCVVCVSELRVWCERVCVWCVRESVCGVLVSESVCVCERCVCVVCV